MIHTHTGVAKLFELIGGIHVNTRRTVERRLKPFDLTYPQFGALLAIARATGGISQKSLGSALESDSTTVMVVCNSLEKKGFLHRRQNPRDRRSNILAFTTEGAKVFERASVEIGDLMKTMDETISEETISELVPQLEAIYRELKRLNEGGDRT